VNVRGRLAICAAGAGALVTSSIALAGFSLTTTATPSLSITLNGTDQSPTYTMDLTVDNSAVGSTLLGWNLTVTSTRFTTGGGSPRTLSTSASSITGVTFVCAVNPLLCTSNPSNSITYPVAVPAGSSPPTAVKFFNAAATTGIGTYTVTPTVKVVVPANAYAGTYTSTLTLTLATGP
jgi:WxL domain surface cell wall-binding